MSYQQRLEDLGLHALVEHFDEISDAAWVPWLLEREEEQRQRRSLERRRKTARLGHFKSVSDYDWAWPERIDRALVDELFTLRFVDQALNVVLVGPNGVGKTMLAKNLASTCLEAGHTVRFTTASEMLNQLAAEDSATALERRLRRLCRPKILCVDEVGYLSYGTRHADLLFEVVSRRYDVKKPIVITTNRPYGEWGRDLSQRHLRGHLGRPPGPPVGDRVCGREVVPPQGKQGAERATKEGAGGEQVGNDPQSPVVAAGFTSARTRACHR